MVLRSNLTCIVLTCLLAVSGQPMAGTMIIDDRSTGTLKSSHFGQWRLVTDQVMGGRSSGELVADQYLGRACLRMRGRVSTENNGGFVQLALDLADGKQLDGSGYTGLELEVAGNGERYNLHLRTSELWLPWQSYRAEFVAGPKWRKISIPFSAFEAYRTRSEFNPAKLIRIGVVAIGRPFDADLCVGRVFFYKE